MLTSPIIDSLLEQDVEKVTPRVALSIDDPFGHTKELSHETDVVWGDVEFTRPDVFGHRRIPFEAGEFLVLAFGELGSLTLGSRRVVWDQQGIRRTLNMFYLPENLTG